MASTEGGVEIEQVAEETLRKSSGNHQSSRRCPAVSGPRAGIQARFKGRSNQTIFRSIHGFGEAFSTRLLLLEINPLVVTTDGDIHCLDAKINIDGNALYRQPAIAEMNDRAKRTSVKHKRLNTASTTSRWKATLAAWSMAPAWPWAPWIW